MRYEEFANLAVQKMTVCFPDMEMHLQRVEKLQNQSYNALVVKAPDDAVGMTFNLDGYYRKWLETKAAADTAAGAAADAADTAAGADAAGADAADVTAAAEESLDAVFRDLAETIRLADPHPPIVDVDFLHNYRKMRECLSMQLIPVKGNEAMLEKVPHMKRQDLAIVFRFVLPGSKTEEASVLLTNDLLLSYGITAQQVEEDAFLICPANHPMVIKNMEEMLFGTCPEKKDDALFGTCPEKKDDTLPGTCPERKDDALPGTCPDNGNDPLQCSLWVISNDTGCNGASAVFYPGALESVAAKFGCGFYLLPSSVHEMLAIPDPYCMGAGLLDKMVENVNATEVLEEDRLTDHCYHYDAETKRFETGKEYEARIIGNGEIETNAEKF